MNLTTIEKNLLNKIRNSKNPTKALIMATSIICSVLSKEEKAK